MFNTAGLLLMAMLLPGAEMECGDEFLANGDANLYWTASNCCGLVATYVICRDLGQPVSLSALSRELPVTARGTSMDAMAKCFADHGLSARGVGLSADALYALLERQPHLRAVVAVANDHWVTVGAARNRRFAIYDYPRWSVVPVDELAPRFRDVALLVSRPADRSALNATGAWQSVARTTLLIGGALCLFAGVFGIVVPRRLCRPALAVGAFSP